MTPGPSEAALEEDVDVEGLEGDDEDEESEDARGRSTRLEVEA